MTMILSYDHPISFRMVCIRLLYDLYALQCDLSVCTYRFYYTCIHAHHLNCEVFRCCVSTYTIETISPYVHYNGITTLNYIQIFISWVLLDLIMFKTSLLLLLTHNYPEIKVRTPIEDYRSQK